MTRNYCRHFIHLVWGTRYRNPSIKPEWKRSILRSLGAACKQFGCMIVTANMVRDHVHALITMPVTVCVSQVIQAMKSASAYVVNRDLDPTRDFRWQRGFGVFSVSPENVPRITRYIRNQEAHHAVKARATSRRLPPVFNDDVEWAEVADPIPWAFETRPVDSSENISGREPRASPSG